LDEFKAELEHYVVPGSGVLYVALDGFSILLGDEERGDTEVAAAAVVRHNQKVDIFRDVIHY
jgi:hypothetical protein